MGAGRSGSTILGVVLGNCDGVFYAGELDAWLARRGVPNFSRPERERFWTAVADLMPHDHGLFDADVRRRIEHSTAVFRIFKGRKARALERRYRHLCAALYGSVSLASGAKVIVDTSHFPLRALQLRKVDNIDLYLIYLVRNPDGVVAAFRRKGIGQPSKGAVSANAYLALTYVLAMLVFVGHPRSRRLLVNYETFVANATSATLQILDWIGEDRVDAPLRGRSLSTGLAFQGNRLLSRDQVALEVSVEKYSLVQRALASPQIVWRLVSHLLRPRLSLKASRSESTPKRW
jgi:hypothetical protein